MYLLWRLLDDKLQTARDLQTAAGRKAFMVWFFGVAPQLDLGPLIAGRWLAWLQSPGAAAAIGPQATQLADALRASAATLRIVHDFVCRKIVMKKSGCHRFIVANTANCQFSRSCKTAYI
jgi:hypothetical protein